VPVNAPAFADDGSIVQFGVLELIQLSRTKEPDSFGSREAGSHKKERNTDTESDGSHSKEAGSRKGGKPDAKEAEGVSGLHDWYHEQNCGEGWGVYGHPGGCPLSQFASNPNANQMPPTMHFFPAICDAGLWRSASVNDAKCYVVSELRGISGRGDEDVMFTVDKEGFQKLLEKSTRSPPTSTDAVSSIKAAARAARE
jgi:hypothetical protein